MLKVVGASWTTSRICSLIIGAVGVVGFLLIIMYELDRPVEDGNYAATVFWTERTGYRIEFWGEGNLLSSIPTGVARAVFKPDIKHTGWAMLEIETQAEYTDEIQAYAAGYLEGSLSWQLIYHHWINTVLEACEGREHYCQQVRYFLRNNTESVRETASQRYEDDPFWRQVHLFYKQLDGLTTGWQFGMIKTQSEFRELSIPLEDFLWMNVVSDLTDLEYMFNGSFDETQSPLAFSAASRISSAFVKLVPSFNDLFVAHNTGGLYRSMLKILKRYEFKYHLTSDVDSATIPGQAIVFSSYPGAIHSQDDFYHVSGVHEHQLAITGTAINNFNPALWEKVNPQDQVLIGPRVMAANRLAINGKSWGSLLGRGNSGTGNKQWLVVDPSRLAHAGKKGLLLVVEQLPGLIHTSDHSHVLWSEGYWASHGLPFHLNILTASGTQTMEKTFGSTFSPKKSPVTQMFRRDQINATDTTSVRHLMRSNNFLDDPLSNGIPLQAIAGRGDISMSSNTVDNPVSHPVGVTDNKILSLTSISQSFRLEATAGPTFNDISHPTEPRLSPFKWSSSTFNTQLHRGQPDLWNFEPFQPFWAWNLI